MLTAFSGGCAIERSFEYYNDPEIMGVFPLQGPRYGSFQLTVNLGASMDFATVDWVRTTKDLQIVELSSQHPPAFSAPTGMHLSLHIKSMQQALVFAKLNSCAAGWVVANSAHCWG